MDYAGIIIVTLIGVGVIYMAVRYAIAKYKDHEQGPSSNEE